MPTEPYIVFRFMRKSMSSDNGWEACPMAEAEIVVQLHPLTYRKVL